MSKKNRNVSSNKSILYNRGVLYFIFILALGYLFYILTTGDFFTLSIFVIIGFLTSFFSKNMVVILSLAMTVSFIFKFGTKIRAEGFEENENSESSEKPKPEEESNPEEESKKKNANADKKESMETAKPENAGAMLTPEQKENITDKLRELNQRLKG